MQQAGERHESAGVVELLEGGAAGLLPRLWGSWPLAKRFQNARRRRELDLAGAPRAAAPRRKGCRKLQRVEGAMVSSVNDAPSAPTLPRRQQMVGRAAVLRASRTLVGPRSHRSRPLPGTCCLHEHRGGLVLLLDITTASLHDFLRAAVCAGALTGLCNLKLAAPAPLHQPGALCCGDKGGNKGE